MKISPTNAIPATEPPGETPGQFDQILQWFERVAPDPSNRDTGTQVGVNLEKVLDMLLRLRDAGSTYPAREQLGFTADVLNYAQRQLKAGAIEIVFEDVDRAALLETLCSQIISAIGTAHMLEMDIGGALTAITETNTARLDDDTQPVFSSLSSDLGRDRSSRLDLSPFTTRRT